MTVILQLIHSFFLLFTVFIIFLLFSGEVCCKSEVGLHQGSAPFLFGLVVDKLTDDVRQESSWTIFYADDVAICSGSREQVEERLERLRSALKSRCSIFWFSLGVSKMDRLENE